MPIRLVDPLLANHAVTLQEDGEWTGEHVSLLRAARSIPIPPSETYKADPILATANYVARVLSLDVIEVNRPKPRPLPPGAIP